MAIVFDAVADGLDIDPEDVLLTEINTTPLVDVMLVLLIIFLITIPVVNAAVSVELPRQRNEARAPQSQTAVVSVDQFGAVYWFDARLSDGAQLQQRLQQFAAQAAQPEVHIRADARSDYAAVASVVKASQLAGIARVGFLTEPAPGAR